MTSEEEVFEGRQHRDDAKPTPGQWFGRRGAPIERHTMSTDDVEPAMRPDALVALLDIVA